MSCEHFRIFNELIEDVYEGAQNWHLWKNYLGKLCKTVGARECFFAFQSEVLPQSYVICSRGDELDQATISSIDDILNLLPDGTDEPFDLAGQVGADHRLAGRDSACIAEQRISTRGKSRVFMFVDFGEPLATKDRSYEFGLLKITASHTRRALNVREKDYMGNCINHYLIDMMNQINIGMILFGRDCNMLYSNDYAKALIRTRQTLRTDGEHLILTDARQQKKFSAALQEAARGFHHRTESICFGISRDGTPESGILNLVISPINTLANVGPAVLVMISDTFFQQTRMNPAALAQIYGLTKCESRICSLLAEGMTVEMAANQLRVSVNTVKTHLRGIYGKFGANRQNQLVSMLQATPARFVTEPQLPTRKVVGARLRRAAGAQPGF